jgi:hypothetical protein
MSGLCASTTASPICFPSAPLPPVHVSRPEAGPCPECVTLAPPDLSSSFLRPAKNLMTAHIAPATTAIPPPSQAITVRLSGSLIKFHAAASQEGTFKSKKLPKGRFFGSSYTRQGRARMWLLRFWVSFGQKCLETCAEIPVEACGGECCVIPFPQLNLEAIMARRRIGQETFPFDTMSGRPASLDAVIKAADENGVELQCCHKADEGGSGQHDGQRHFGWQGGPRRRSSSMTVF